MNPADIYNQLGRLLEEMPDLSGFSPLTHDQLVWIGRAGALVKVSGDTLASVDFDQASKALQVGPTRGDGVRLLVLTLYKVLGRAELEAPPSVRGKFIPAGNSFDAFAAISKVLQSATTDILIVDPYMDETVLVDFGSAVSQSVSLRLLADGGYVKPTFAPAATRWKQQYPQMAFGARLAAPRTLHDRAIFVDRAVAWTLTQSLKDFAKRSPAELIRDDSIAPLKISAYEAIWLNSQTVA